jgi:hypothetical protein
MRIRVVVHGLLTVAVRDPGNALDMTVPEGVDIRGLIEILQERSPVFDPRASIAVMEGARVPLDRTLQAGEELHLYPIFGGG